MALIKCVECAAQISDSAKKCPQCGAEQPRKTSRLTWIVGALLAIGIGKAILDANGENGGSRLIAAKQQPTQADKELNAAVTVVKSIKLRMKNPDAFNLEAFLIFPGGLACVEYRSTNSFNAVVPGRAVFQPQAESILMSDRDGKQFIKAWNELCTKPGGVDRAQGLNLLGVV